ncbi:MAG: aminotransferase class IV [Phycisphaerales bacterium]
MLVYLNGAFLPADQARISPFDRGFLFGDGVYEVVRYFNRRPVRLRPHIERLARSMREIQLTGFDAELLGPVGEELLLREELSDASIYWQVTRGVEATRRHVPAREMTPTVFAYAESTPSLDECREPRRMKAILYDDIRWGRGDIKSISLLGGLLGKLAARDAGGDEAIFHRDGLLTEGGATNVIVVDRAGIARTPPLAGAGRILDGITRGLVLEVAPEIRVEPIRVDSLGSSREVLLIGTRTFVGSVIELEGQRVGEGIPGPFARELNRRLVARLRAEA